MRKRKLSITIGLIFIVSMIFFTYKNTIFQEGNPLPIFKGIINLYISSNDLAPISADEGFIQKELVEALGVSREEVDYVINIYKATKIKGEF